MPDKVDLTYPSGVTLTRQYSYDAQNRVVQITNADSTYPETITYLGTDTVVFHDFQYQNGRNIFIQRVFNSFGDHLRSDIYSIGKNGDTLLVQNSAYYYDAVHQVQQSVFYNASYTSGNRIRQLYNSSNYLWTNSNLSQKVSSAAELTMSYEYLPNSNGYFIYNTPACSDVYILNTLSKGKLSANLVLKSTDGNGNMIDYVYTFDGSGRVKTVSFSGHKYTFHWKCV